MKGIAKKNQKPKQNLCGCARALLEAILPAALLPCRWNRGGGIFLLITGFPLLNKLFNCEWELGPFRRYLRASAQGKGGEAGVQIK